MLTTKTWRPWAAATAAAGLLLAGSAVPAQAGALQRIESVVDSITCTARTTGGDAVIVTGDALLGGQPRSEAFVEGGEGVILAGGGDQFTIDGQLFIAVDLLTVPGGDPAGTVTVTAEVQGLREPQVETVDERTGNTWTRGTFTVEEYAFGAVSMAVTGLTIDGSTVSCDGQRFTFSVVSNDPAAIVRSFTDFGTGICPVAGLPGGLMVLRGELSAPYLELIVGDGGEDPAKAAGALERRGPVWGASLPLVSLTTGEELAILDVTVDLNRVGHQVARYSDGGVTRQVWSTPFLADLTVTGPGLEGSASCIALAERFQVRLAPGTEDHH